MNIVNLVKLAKIAWTDEGTIKSLIAAAKVAEGPKPSWQTGEFWINQVMPTTVVIFGGFSGLIPPMWFVIGLLVLATVGYLGRTALKIVHVWSGASTALDPDTIAQVGDTVTTLISAVGAVKAATAGNLDAAKNLTETLNAPTTVNVNTTPAAPAQ